MIGTLELLGQQLDLAGELRDLQLAGLDLLARRHQLHVVDDDQAQVVALLEPAGLGPDLHHRHVGRVVDEHRRRGDLAHLARQLGPVVVVHVAVADVVERDLRLGREQAHGDLGARHLQAEEDARQVVVDRRGAAQVERQRGVVRRDRRSARRGRGGRRCRPARSAPAPSRPGGSSSIFTAEPSGSAIVCTCPSVATSSRSCAPARSAPPRRRRTGVGRHVADEPAVPPLNGLTPRGGAGRPRAASS